MRAENDLSLKHSIEVDCRQKEFVKACIIDLVKILSDLYDGGREWHAEQTTALLNTENFRLNEKRHTLNVVFACLLLVRQTSNKTFKKYGL